MYKRKASSSSQSSFSNKLQNEKGKLGVTHEAQFILTAKINQNRNILIKNPILILHTAASLKKCML